MRLDELRKGMIAFLKWEDLIPEQRRSNSAIADSVYGHPALILDEPIAPAPRKKAVYVMLLVTFNNTPIEKRFRDAKGRKENFPQYLPMQPATSHYPGYKPVNLEYGRQTGRRGYIQIGKIHVVHLDMLQVWKPTLSPDPDYFTLTAGSWDHITEKLCALPSRELCCYNVDLHERALNRLRDRVDSFKKQQALQVRKAQQSQSSSKLQSGSCAQVGSGSDESPSDQTPLAQSIVRPVDVSSSCGLHVSLRKELPPIPSQDVDIEARPAQPNVPLHPTHISTAESRVWSSRRVKLQALKFYHALLICFILGAILSLMFLVARQVYGTHFCFGNGTAQGAGNRFWLR